jgi:hypothetical protein
MPFLAVFLSGIKLIAATLEAGYMAELASFEGWFWRW